MLSFLPKDCSGARYCRTIPAWGPVVVEEQKASCQTDWRKWASSSTVIPTPSQRESLFQTDPSPPNQFLQLEPPHSLKTRPQLLRAKFPNVSHHASERRPLPVFQIWVPHPIPFTCPPTILSQGQHLQRLRSEDLHPLKRHTPLISSAVLQIFRARTFHPSKQEHSSNSSDLPPRPFKAAGHISPTRSRFLNP